MFAFADRDKFSNSKEHHVFLIKRLKPRKHYTKDRSDLKNFDGNSILNLMVLISMAALKDIVKKLCGWK